MGYLIDKYMFDNISQTLSETSKQTKFDLIKGKSFGSILEIANTYMSEDDISNEYKKLRPLLPKDLKVKSFFAKKRNYFI